MTIILDPNSSAGLTLSHPSIENLGLSDSLWDRSQSWMSTESQRIVAGRSELSQVVANLDTLMSKLEQALLRLASAVSSLEGFMSSLEGSMHAKRHWGNSGAPFFE